MRAHPNHCTFLKEHGCAIISIHSALTDDELKSLHACTADLLAHERPHGAVLDLTGLDVADSFTMQNLRQLCALFHVYGVRIVLAGIQPDVAVVMAMRGFSWRDETYAADITEALAMLEWARAGHTPVREVQYYRARRVGAMILGRHPRG